MESTPSKKRLAWPMLLLHLVAWGITLAVGAAFVYVNSQHLPLGYAYSVSSAGGVYTEKNYGWPIFCRKWKETLSGYRYERRETSSHLHLIALFFNVVMGLLLLAGTFFVFVVPLLRKRKPFQIKLESFFILTATVAFLSALYRTTYSSENRTVVPIQFFGGDASLIGDRNFDFAYIYQHSFPLYLQILLGIGIGCAIYMGIWIVLSLVTALVRILVKRRAVAQSE